MNSTPLDNYLEDFEALNDSPIMSMDKIEWWLLKHSDIHAEIVSYLKEHNINYCPKVNYCEHPQHNTVRPFMDFLVFHHFVNQISECARNDDYYKQEMKEYYRIKHSMLDLKEWVKKNQEFGLGYFPDFINNYYTYGISQGLVWPYDELFGIQIRLDWNPFSFTIYFLKIFNELFYDKEILPSRLKVVKADAKRILEEYLKKENYVNDDEASF